MLVKTFVVDTLHKNEFYGYEGMFEHRHELSSSDVNYKKMSNLTEGTGE
jgi:hypothetical protein